MSVISNALKTAQQEKQRRESGGRMGPAPLLVPLRSKPEPQFSWQRAASLGIGGALVLAAAWFAFGRGRDDGRPRPQFAVTPPAVSVAAVPAVQDSPRAVSEPVAASVPPTTGAADSAREPAPVSSRAAPLRTAERRSTVRAPTPAVLQGRPAPDSAADDSAAPPREPAQSGRLRIAVEQPREEDAARLFAMGVAAHRAGDLAAARSAYERVLLMAPNDVDALNNLGVLLAAMREFDRAEQVLRRAIRLAPRNAGAWNNLGTVLAQRGQPNDAIAAYQHALSIDPRHQGARVSLAQQHLAIGAADRARELLEEVLATNPAQAEAHYALGQAFELQKDWAGAIQSYLAFIRVAPPRLAADVERVRVRVDMLSRKSR